MNQANKNILVIGSLNMDLVVTVRRHPVAGETIFGTGFHTFPGGKGANQSVAAARLGNQAKLMGRVGQDAFGETLRKTITDNGVDTHWVLSDEEAPTGLALITVEATGQNTIVVVPGANAQVKPDDILAAESLFETAAILVAQLEIPLPPIQTAIELACRHGLKVILNPAPAPDIETCKELLTGVDYLIPNQSELRQLAGTTSLEAGIQQLHKSGVKNLIITLGENGAFVSAQGRQVHIPPFRVAAVDTTAAGDAFIGAFAVALSEGLDLFEAARWGNAAGALAATRPGAQPSLPTRKELLELLRR